MFNILTAKIFGASVVALLAIIAFLSLRLALVDGSRDDWRDKAQSYEAAAKALAEADKAADRIGADRAAQSKGTIDDGNERARAAAGASDDPLRAGFDSLRAENRGGDKAPR